LIAAAIGLRIPAQPISRIGRPALLDWRPALRNRQAVAYNLAYAAHMWELYGFRAWLVAFLAFAVGREGGGPGTSLTTIAAIILALALPASVLGNEAALRFGRRQVLTAVMLASAAMAVLVGWSATLPFAAVIALAGLYSLTVSADSASLTAGAVGAALPRHRGATMALHTLIGFAAASLGPLAFGAVLDFAGSDQPRGWLFAFALLGAGVALGPLILRLMQPAER
jgi:MFS family permease